MATFHVLNGDCLAEQLKETKINQDFIVCRECLIDGDVLANNLSDFWTIRAAFIAENYDASSKLYMERTANELGKLSNLSSDSEVCLWFENDLFCQTNMWFVLFLLSKRPDLIVYRIFPVIKNQAKLWSGFGKATTEMLEAALTSKVRFQQTDIALGASLWKAHQENNFKKLQELSAQFTTCFQYLTEVCQAHIDRFGSVRRPEKVLKEIMKTQPNDFNSIFAKFSEKEGICGFGDLQIKRILNTI